MTGLPRRMLPCARGPLPILLHPARSRHGSNPSTPSLFAADSPATDGHIIVGPKEHVTSIHALPMAVQKGVWALISEVAGTASNRTGAVPQTNSILIMRCARNGQ
jgi:diadenosine tetraphosphate (Ap4A) HIT family hydrolase